MMGERSRTACGSVRLTLCNSREGENLAYYSHLILVIPALRSREKTAKIGPIYVVIASSLAGICQWVRVNWPYGIVTQVVTTEVGPRSGVPAP